MIIPAIIAKDFEELKTKLNQVEGLVSWAQIDVMDGVFVPPKTWDNSADLENISTAINLEAHLMVSHPENIIDKWINSPVKRILLHYESTDSETIVSLLKKITDAGKSAGIALKLETPLWVFDFLIDSLLATRYSLPSIQLMAISEIGYQGHPFEEKTLERIKTLREKYPDVIISIDGGVNLENASKIISAGADNLVVGSAIFKSDNIKETLEKFDLLKN
ncbi:MAG: hypothetical protein AAB949_01675 [Patescibacteria group bacterium]